MKKRKSKILLFVILFLISGCVSNEITLSVESDDECFNKPVLLMKTNDYNVYTYCIKNEKINISGNEMSLKEYLSNNEEGIDRIIESLNYVETLSDGGTQMYNGSANLIKCHTLDNNNDIYIGSSQMKYKENFCKNDNTTFVRTYKIKKVENYYGVQYEDNIPVTYGNSFKVSLIDYKNKEYDVIINNLWNTTLKKNNYYEFEFKLYKADIEFKDNPVNIFKNAQIIEVRKVDSNLINEETN